MFQQSSKKPLVSVILNTHNGSKFLKQCILSVLKQSYKKFELIIFDNKSTDTTKKIVRKFSKDKRIKYYYSKKYLKLYQARNSAVLKSKGSLISFIDSDDWWIRDKLSKQVNYFIFNKEIKIVYSNLFLYFEKNKKYKLFSKSPLYNGNITQLLLNNFKMPILTTMLKRELFKKNKFNKKYDIIGDFDFFIRLSLKYKINSSNEPLAYYRVHNSNMTDKRIDSHIKELEEWTKTNQSNDNLKFYNFNNVNSLVNILRIKKNFKDNKKLEAFKLYIKKPYSIKKFKYLMLFFLSHKKIKEIL